MVRKIAYRAEPHDWDTVAPLDHIIDHKLQAAGHPPSAAPRDRDADYQKRRDELKRREAALGFEWKCTTRASAKEKRVDQILQGLKRHDEENVYAKEPPRQSVTGQPHPRFAGDHFLSNKALINRTKVFDLAKRVPKGAHLHIHFNACLQPDVLLKIASEMEQMYITSDVPLHTTDEAHHERYRRCKIQFSIMDLTASKGSLFDPAYKDRTPMKFKEFIKEFPQHRGGMSALEWLQERLVFREEEAHDLTQTVSGAWEEFNTRTQMMKGLFNYERAYREYTRRCLEDFVRDNIQYAEIRPNFMDTNQVWTDDGTRKIDNVGIMEMIIQEVERFQRERQGGGDAAATTTYFAGLKIIYCCPRSYPREKVANGLAECLRFKQRWPGWIAGFDLVGEEGKGQPLRAFVPEFLQFQADCAAAVPPVGEIPFLFHCGETLDSGAGTPDDNLADALLLGSRRIGHGFSLARHPYLMERMKKAGVCVELCPISNEVLGLTPRVGGHAMYGVLANNVHCTVSSDNGTLFNSTLSHDFYQAMIGKPDMTLFGWKQLIEWSLEHACMSPAEHRDVLREWEVRWERFLDVAIEEFGGFDSDSGDKAVA
ncbi:hypothetical protein Daus18300_004624 [Diaporthe australafricana]|uniref:Adenosine deaminase domain-containing protein n=1 Tax=Diaporthe australafricana TaxID=127596 RepID=A0ABR3X7Q5_9PEZI